MLDPAYARSQRPSALARWISAWPRGRIRPSAISASTSPMLRCDHSDAGRRGVNRSTNVPASRLRFCPSIHPLHSASSTASA